MAGQLTPAIGLGHRTLIGLAIALIVVPAAVVWWIDFPPDVFTNEWAKLDRENTGNFVEACTSAVQAFGALLALWVAIAVDRNAATRAEAARQAEWSRQRDERSLATEAAREARLGAIAHSIAVLSQLCAEILATNMTPADVGTPPWDAPFRLRAAKAALAYYLNQPTEMSPALIGAVALAHEKLNDLIRVADRRPTFATMKDRDDHAEIYRIYVRDFHGLLAAAKGG